LRQWQSGKLQIERRYPTQAKGRLEWGTQRLLLVWQKQRMRVAILTSTQQK
jgi:hypothetical protein